MRTIYLIVSLFLFISLTSYSQIERKIQGTWVVSGNNVYIYQFMDSGKLIVSDSDGSSEMESTHNSWEIEDDSLMYFRYTKGDRTKENTFKLREINSSKMILFDDVKDREMVFHKISPNKKSNKDLAIDLQFDTHYVLSDADADSLICKVKFENDGKCLMYDIALPGNTEYNSRWILFKKDDGTFLRIDDFEIFLVNDIDEKNGAIELVTHGFLKTLFGIENVRMTEIY